MDGQIRFVGKIQMLELAFCVGISFARRQVQKLQKWVAKILKGFVFFAS